MRSPLDHASRQITLPDVDAPTVPATRKPRGGRSKDYTGRQFLTERPEAYRRAVELLAGGASIASISREIGASWNTVAAIVHAESTGRTLEELRAQSSAEFRTVGRLATMRMVEVMADPNATFKPRDLGALALAAKTASEQAELLSGGATQRVEHISTPNPDDFEQMLRALPAAEIIDTRIVRETSGHSPRLDSGQVANDHDQADARPAIEDAAAGNADDARATDPDQGKASPPDTQSDDSQLNPLQCKDAP